MELLYASRQSASDVPRARVNLLGEFCSRMHRSGLVRYGTPHISVGIMESPDSYFMCWSGAETYVRSVSQDRGFDVFQVVCIFVLSGCVIRL